MLKNKYQRIKVLLDAIEVVQQYESFALVEEEFLTLLSDCLYSSRMFPRMETLAFAALSRHSAVKCRLTRESNIRKRLVEEGFDPDYL